MPKLAAEEELTLRRAAAHPHLAGRDQINQERRLLALIGHVEPVRKATHADLRSIGITVKEN